jgi:hypothetical protein
VVGLLILRGGSALGDVFHELVDVVQSGVPFR